MLIALMLLQTANPAPDIELDIRARARSVEIRQKGEAKLQVRAEPDGGSRVEARVEPKANGRTRLRSVQVDVHAEASLAGPDEIRVEAETAPPQ